jgi:filamentous hemagglutinin family protein
MHQSNICFLPSRRNKHFFVQLIALGKLCSFLLLGLMLLPGHGLAFPTGGTVSSGSAQITNSASDKMQINQSTDKAIIDWTGFSIGSQEWVDFKQPSSSSVTLNRVNDGDPSQIFGQLTANGTLMLVNPNGVLFGPNSRVDVGGLVATTVSISNDDFMAGQYNFHIPSSVAGASVENQGSITIADRGLAALVAPSVSNSGVVQARLGKVALAAGETFTLDMQGDQFLSFAVNSTVANQLGDQALVTQSGTISAAGGKVLLTAPTAENVINNSINMSGIIEAKTAEMVNGEIILSGGESGLVEMSGTLDASGKSIGESGGDIQVLGDLVGLFGHAKVDASGDLGGGTILVGGDFQGKNPKIQNASRTFMGSNATINADAISNGDGGKVILWADDTTWSYGSISAQGGALGGDGGFVEVSGKGSLVFRSVVDTSAINGVDGTILLDPTDITIADGAGGADDAEVSGDNVILSGDSAGAITIAEQTLEGLSGTIILQATQDIILEDLSDDVLNLSNVSSADDFLMQAGRHITFTDTTDSITTNGGEIHLEADSPEIGADGTGTLTVGALTSRNAGIYLMGSDLILNSAINSGNSWVYLGLSQATAMTIGSGVLSNSELQLVTAGYLLNKSKSAVLAGNAISTYTTVNPEGLTIDQPISLTTSGGISLSAGTSTITIVADLSIDTRLSVFDAVTLSSDSVITAPEQSYYSTINSDGTNRSLSLVATGAVDIRGDVGGTASLNSFSLNSSDQVDLQNVTANNIAVTGSNIDLNGTTYTASTDDVTFTGAVDLDAGSAITITSGGGANDNSELSAKPFFPEISTGHTE